MLPAITDAARMIPDLAIDWVVEEGFRAVPGWHPAVQTVIPVAIRRWRKSLFSTQTLRAISTTRKLIRATEYDAIIDSQGLLKSALITHWARGRHYGYHSDSAKEPLASWAYDQHYSVAKDRHAIDRNRQLTALALDYHYQELPLDYGLGGLTARFPAVSIDLPRHYIMALHGTSRPDKEWPEENWLALSQRLSDQGSPLVFPWGNELEHQRAQRIAEKTRAMVLPRLSLDQLASIILGSKAVAGMDTGLMHIAAALNKPGVALYLASDPVLTGVKVGAEAPTINSLYGEENISVDNVYRQLITAD